MRPERGGRSKLRRRGGARGEEGRAAGPLRASPGRAGLPRPPGSRERAGRTQGEVSSCFPWLERGAAAARGAGTLAPGQGDSFFLFKASSLPPGGARVCGRVEAGGGAVPTPDARPAGTRRRRAGPAPANPHLGPLAAPPDSSGRGREARAHLRPAASKWETEAGGGRWAGPGGRAAGRRPGGAGTQGSQPWPSLLCTCEGLTTPQSLLMSTGPPLPTKTQGGGTPSPGPQWGPRKKSMRS